jgi:hypothetical protein
MHESERCAGGMPLCRDPDIGANLATATGTVISLVVVSDLGAASVVASAPYFRITGGSVWIGPDSTGEMPLARYFAGRWLHGDVLWSGVQFEGKCRLVFGLPRDPAGVSGRIDQLSLEGHTLSANGIPFAVYDHRREMWRGAGANRWWHAFRVESAELRGVEDEPPVRAGLERQRAAPRVRGKDTPTIN